MIIAAIIGFVLIVLSFALKSQNTSFGKLVNPLKFIGFFIILIGVLSSLFVQIEAGTVGVKALFGEVKPAILESGLHIVNPMIDVTPFDIQTQNYTMSASNEEGDQLGDDAIRVLSADGLEVVIDLTVLYRVDPVEAPVIFKKLGVTYSDKIVRPVTRTRIRDNAVFYDAVALYSSKREEFQDKIYKSINEDFKKRGIILEDLLIRNINLPASVKTTIESKINAEQEAQKMQFVLQKEEQEATRKRVEAQGIADYQKIISSGLTEKQLQYEAIKAQLELAKSTNSKIIIMNGKGNVPILLSDK